MLYLDIVRSPYAHAKINNIDISKATAIPGVLAVITGKDLEKYNLHWMPTLMDGFRHAARYVDEILKGSRPGDLPVEQPMRFELTINANAVKALGLTLTPSVLTRVDELIQ